LPSPRTLQTSVYYLFGCEEKLVGLGVGKKLYFLTGFNGDMYRRV
jgi:hypothetical protein